VFSRLAIAASICHSAARGQEFGTENAFRVDLQILPGRIPVQDALPGDTSMISETTSFRLRCAIGALVAAVAFDAVARDREQPNRENRKAPAMRAPKSSPAPTMTAPAAPRNFGGGNRGPTSSGGNVAPRSVAPQKIETPRVQPQMMPPKNIPPQVVQPKNTAPTRNLPQVRQPAAGNDTPRIQLMNQPGGRRSENNNKPPNKPNTPNIGGNAPGMKRNDNKPGGNNPPNIGGAPTPRRKVGDNKPGGGISAPNLGGNNPVPRRGDKDHKPGGGINAPNPGGNNPNLGNQPVPKRGGDNKPGGGNNAPNPGGNNPNLGNQQVPKRGGDNKPGGGNNTPNLGGNNPNPGNKPVLKRGDGDNKPGGINRPNLGGNNPNLGNAPNLGRRGDGDGKPGVDRNPEFKKSLKQFEPKVSKRQENEKQLIRNKDQVDQLLTTNPRLRERAQTPDGKVDFSKLHLERGGKDRIPTFVHKNGELPVKGDRDFQGNRDFAKRFQHDGTVKDLDQLNDRMKRFRDPDMLKAHPELRNVNWNRVSGQFQNQLAHQRFDHLAGSRFGRQLHLQQQFNLYQRGDVARQLNLNVALINNGGWRNRYVGPVFGGFAAGSFSAWYCGPGFYPRYCWTPMWSPWVDWCWWNTCPIIYDPRPIFVRPIVYYDPCPVWVVYSYPVWQPLPVVASGTWVDLPPATPVANVDLQLLAVRFVDNGHPDQNLGARYRVWLQNNSSAGINGAFNVLLMAGNSADASADLPQAGITIPSMDAGEMKVVDVRLPFAANRMNVVDNRSTPFNFLHVLVDSHRQLEDANPANNGAVLARDDILPVDPAAFAPDVTAAAPGALVSIAGEGFGPEPGRLIVSVNGEQTEAMVYGWYDLGVQFELPNVPVTEPTDAEVLVVRGDGAASNPVTVRLAPETQLEDAALPPAPEP
jgi:hypothetical protein